MINSLIIQYQVVNHKNIQIILILNEVSKFCLLETHISINTYVNVSVSIITKGAHRFEKYHDGVYQNGYREERDHEKQCKHIYINKKHIYENLN